MVTGEKKRKSGRKNKMNSNSFGQVADFSVPRCRSSDPAKAKPDERECAALKRSGRKRKSGSLADKLLDHRETIWVINNYSDQDPAWVHLELVASKKRRNIPTTGERRRHEVEIKTITGYGAQNRKGLLKEGHLAWMARSNEHAEGPRNNVRGGGVKRKWHR